MKKLVLGLILLVLVLVKVNFITKTEATPTLSTSSKIEDVEEIYIKDKEEFNAREVDDNNSSSNTLNSIMRGEELNSSSKSNIEEDEEDLNSSSKSNVEEDEEDLNSSSDDCEENVLIDGEEMCVDEEQEWERILPSEESIESAIKRKAEEIHSTLYLEERSVCKIKIFHHVYKIVMCDENNRKVGIMLLESEGIA